MIKSSINIYIVESDEALMQALKENIEHFFVNKNIKIYSFITGKSFLSKFNDVKPDIVILDYHINRLNVDDADSIKVLDFIKKANANTNVIMLTSEDKIEIALKTFSHGASDYVVKTQTQLMKVNYSLYNLIEMVASKHQTRKYKVFMRIFLVMIGLAIGGLFLIKFFAPSLLR